MGHGAGDKLYGIYIFMALQLLQSAMRGASAYGPYKGTTKALFNNFSLPNLSFAQLQLLASQLLKWAWHTRAVTSTHLTTRRSIDNRSCDSHCHCDCDCCQLSSVYLWHFFLSLSLPFPLFLLLLLLFWGHSRFVTLPSFLQNGVCTLAVVDGCRWLSTVVAACQQLKTLPCNRFLQLPNNLIWFH